MPYVKTGRPPGRPKTKEYVTLMARVPQDIADQAKRYAAHKRQTISEVLRDGLDMLLQDNRYRPFISDTNGAQLLMADIIPTPEILSDTIPTPELVSDTNGTQDIMSDTIHQQHLPEIVYDMNDAVPEQEIVSDMNGTQDIMSDMNSALPEGHYLGKLCPRNHEYQDSGKTLLTHSNNECPECAKVRSAERRQRKREQKAREQKRS